MMGFDPGPFGWLCLAVMVIAVAFFGMLAIGGIASAWADRAKAKVKEKELELEILKLKEKQS